MIYRVSKDAQGDNYIDVNTEAEAIELSNQLGFGYFQFTPPSEWNIEVFMSKLSMAFDSKFETYWRTKGYTDLSDLISHSVNTESIYHSEALSLLQWSHSSWEIAVTDLDENSNIETIINSLPVYE